ncbi:peptidase [Streptomyces chumphonensis]
MTLYRRTVWGLSTAVTLLVVATSSAFAHTPPAETKPSTPGATTTSLAATSEGARVNSTSGGEAVEHYWTPERMRDARPVSVDAAGHGESGHERRQEPQASGTAGSTPPAAPASGEIRTALYETSVAGKVFFTDPSDGRDYVCSASALNSASKQMVITAGHCVHGGDGGDWMRNWAYVPRYRDGNRPYGTFAAKEFRAFNGWINNSDLDWDVAMVTTWPRDGDKLVNVTGGNGLSYNYSREQDVTVNGYPGDRDNGQRQWYCTGTTERVSVFDGKIQLRCDFGGGSSGGPWMRKFDDASGLGYTNGVTSTVNSDGWNKSPYFGDSVKQMFDDQGSAT